MLYAWLLTLPGAGAVGGVAALLSDRGVGGVIALLVFLAASCAVIYAVSRRHAVTAHNVGDSHEVLVLTDSGNYRQEPRIVTEADSAKSKGAA
jgi:hypothetical protein